MRGLRQRGTNAHGRTGRARGDGELAAELAHPLPHAMNADAGKFMAISYAGRSARSETAAAVADDERDAATTPGRGDRRRRAVRVAVNVGEALLHDAVERLLDMRRQTAQIGHARVDVDATLPAEARRVPTHGRRQTAVVEQRRVQQVCQRTDLLRARLDEGAALRDERPA